MRRLDYGSLRKMIQMRRIVYETNYSNDASSYIYLIPYCYANAYYSVCKDKELMNHMFTEIYYIIYASKLYGGKRVMEKLNQRYSNKLMS